MPTGVALRDVREQLFGAADRILLRDGPNGLTSRAVTTEAGVSKGVLHKHFADFDDFLAAYVLDRADRMDPAAAALRDAAGTGTIVGNVADALTAVFGSVAVAIVALVSYRDELRARLRDPWPAGVPVLTDAITLITDYLHAERDLGRLNPSAEPDFLAPMLVGTTHLLFADRTGPPPDAAAVHKAVAAALSSAVRE